MAASARTGCWSSTSLEPSTSRSSAPFRATPSAWRHDRAAVRPHLARGPRIAIRLPVSVWWRRRRRRNRPLLVAFSRAKDSSCAVSRSMERTPSGSALVNYALAGGTSPAQLRNRPGTPDGGHLGHPLTKLLGQPHPQAEHAHDPRRRDGARATRPALEDHREATKAFPRSVKPASYTAADRSRPCPPKPPHFGLARPIFPSRTARRRRQATRRAAWAAGHHRLDPISSSSSCSGSPTIPTGGLTGWTSLASTRWKRPRPMAEAPRPRCRGAHPLRRRRSRRPTSRPCRRTRRARFTRNARLPADRRRRMELIRRALRPPRINWSERARRRAARLIDPCTPNGIRSAPWSASSSHARRQDASVMNILVAQGHVWPAPIPAHRLDGAVAQSSRGGRRLPVRAAGASAAAARCRRARSRPEGVWCGSIWLGTRETSCRRK